MSVTPAGIAVALGRTAPDPESVQYQQWAMWIADAENQIQWRKDDLGVTDDLDETKVDYVIREAVVAHVRHPDDATNVTVSVDDGSASRTYRSGSGRVRILDEWWALLGLTPADGGAFTLDMAGCGSSHLPWCDVYFNGTTCSCGASLAGYPIYELG